MDVRAWPGPEHRGSGSKVCAYSSYHTWFCRIPVAFLTPCTHFLPLEASLTCTNLAVNQLGQVQCPEAALGDGEGVLSPLGHLLVGQFLPNTEQGLPGARQCIPQSHSFSPPPIFLQEVSRRPACHPNFSRKPFLSLRVDIFSGH